MKLVTKVIRLTHNLTTVSFEIKQKLEEPKLINHINMQFNIEILQTDYPAAGCLQVKSKVKQYEHNKFTKAHDMLLTDWKN